MHMQKQQIVRQVKENYALQADVNELDDKIKLLISNRATLDEALNLKNSKKTGEENEAAIQRIPPKQKELYGSMFYYLQTRPLYLARLISLAKTKKVKQTEVEKLLQVIVTSLFGDQYDSREERLLLALFKHVLTDEFAGSKGNMGSFMRANTPATSMLGLYARRPGSMRWLKHLLEPLMVEIFAPENKDLNLEIKPHAVYMQYINDWEASTGKTSELPKVGVSDVVAAINGPVQELIAERVPRLQALCEQLLTRLHACACEFPFGIRWICKEMEVLARRTFSTATEQQIYSIVGGFVILRYINPAIVAPDGNQIIAAGTKPSKKQRRNLILIAKVLQNVSNGILFADKEVFMVPLNKFVESHQSKMVAFFEELNALGSDEADAETDLNHQLDIDLFLQHTAPKTNICVSMNEVHLVQRLLLDHYYAADADGAASAESVDPLLSSLEELEPPPPAGKQLPRSEDFNMNLILEALRSVGGGASDDEADGGGAKGQETKGRGVLSRAVTARAAGKGKDAKAKRRVRAPSVLERMLSTSELTKMRKTQISEDGSGASGEHDAPEEAASTTTSAKERKKKVTQQLNNVLRDPDCIPLEQVMAWIKVAKNNPFSKDNYGKQRQATDAQLEPPVVADVEADLNLNVRQMKELLAFKKVSVIGVTEKPELRKLVAEHSTAEQRAATVAGTLAKLTGDAATADAPPVLSLRSDGGIACSLATLLNSAYKMKLVEGDSSSKECTAIKELWECLVREAHADETGEFGHLTLSRPVVPASRRKPSGRKFSMRNSATTATTNPKETAERRRFWQLTSAAPSACAPAPPPVSTRRSQRVGLPSPPGGVPPDAPPPPSPKEASERRRSWQMGSSTSASASSTTTTTITTSSSSSSTTTTTSLSPKETAEKRRSWQMNAAEEYVTVVSPKEIAMRRRFWQIASAKSSSGVVKTDITKEDLKKFFKTHDASKVMDTDDPKDMDLEELIEESTTPLIEEMLMEEYGEGILSKEVKSVGRSDGGGSTEAGENAVLRFADGLEAGREAEAALAAMAAEAKAAAAAAVGKELDEVEDPSGGLGGVLWSVRAAVAGEDNDPGSGKGGLKEKQGRKGDEVALSTARAVKAVTVMHALLRDECSLCQLQLRAFAKLAQRSDELDKVNADVVAHRSTLEDKLDMFRMYLDSTREQLSSKKKRGAADKTARTKSEGGGAASSSATGPKKGLGGLGASFRGARAAKPLIPKQRKVKFTLKTLLESGVVMETDLSKTFHKMVTFVFVEEAPGSIVVTAGMKAAGATMGAVTRTLLLEDLLEQQERNITEMEINEDTVDLKLNINKVIHLINTNFL
jgi:hypothetical protein